MYNSIIYNFSDKIILYQSKLATMNKMSHLSFKEIVRKRTLNSLDKQSLQHFKGNTSLQESNLGQDNETNQNQMLTNIIEQFSKDPKNSPPIFSTQIKHHLVEFISKQLNMSLNATKMSQKIKIKRIARIEIIERINQKNSKKSQNINSATGIAAGTRKLDLQKTGSIKSLMNHKKYSYFVLTGTMYNYNKDTEKSMESTKRAFFEEEISHEKMFFNWKQFQKEYPDFRRTKTYSQFAGFGPVFSFKPANQPEKDVKDFISQKQITLGRSNTACKNVQFLLGQDCIYVQVQNPQYQDEYINHSGMQFQKMTQIIQGFSIFNTLGKKMKNFIQNFEYKEYKRNQQVYRIGDPVNKFYLIIKGQIVFELNKTNPIKTSLMNSPTNSRKNSLHMQMTIKTQTVSSGSYFGQEQMIFQMPERLLTAKCKSSKCQILQISKQRFQRMLDYSDFHESVKRSAEVKFHQRLSKMSKNESIRTKFALTQQNQEKSQDLNLKSQRLVDKKAASLFNTPKASLDGRYKVMHGNVIRQFSKQQKVKMTETVDFSMLKVNPDMYEKTMDKFRKYSIKPRQKYVPQINWELKRVWKVLNLQNILREQAQVGSPEGRKFYDSHKRYLGHLNQSKSLRPKTSSSTYRTKLQYIAYLQQFKRQDKN